MLNKIVLLSCFVAITFSQHIVHHQCPVRPILQSFNLTQYLGRWYEISRYEQRFSLNCDCGFADYTLNPDGTVHVRNCCKRLPNTTESCVVGKAALSNPNDNPIPGKLSVAFRGQEPSVSNYWILDTDYDNFVIVYYCKIIDDDTSSEAFWLLSRTPKLNSKVKDLTDSLTSRFFEPKDIRIAEQGVDKCLSDHEPEVIEVKN